MEKGGIIQDDYSGRMARKEKAQSLIHQQLKKKRQWQHNCIPTGNVPTASKDEVPLLLMQQQLMLKSPDDKSVDENLCYVNMGFIYTTKSNATSPEVCQPEITPSFTSLPDESVQVIEDMQHASTPPRTPLKNLPTQRKSSQAFVQDTESDTLSRKTKSEEVVGIIHSKEKTEGNGDSNSSPKINGNLTNNNVKLKEIWSSISLDNLQEFVMMSPPVGTTIQCRLERDKFGIDKNIFPIYSLFLDAPNMQKTLVMAARKRMKSTTSYYVISTNSHDISKKDGDNFIGKLRSNLVGTQFVLYDSGFAPHHAGNDINLIRKELASVVYESNILGFNGPRNMTVIIPSVSSQNQRSDHRPIDSNDSLYAT